MLVALRDDADLVKALLPVVRSRLLTTNPLDPSTAQYLAVLAARARQLDDAERLYRSCLEAGQFGPNRENEAEVYGGLLDVLNQARKNEAIVQVCRAGLEHAEQTNRFMFYLDLSQALARLGKYDEAVEEATHEVEVGGQNRLHAVRHRAFVLAQAGRAEQAVAECQAALKEFSRPEEVRETRHTLALVYSEGKEPARAEEQLRRIIKDYPEDAWAHNDLGYELADRNKDLEEAEALVRRALELDRRQRAAGSGVVADADQDNAAYLDSLGWVLFRRGTLDEARQQLEKAVTLADGDDPVLWDHLGDTYAKLNEAARARASWQKAVELYGAGKRRAQDERYKDIQQKLKLLAPAAPPR
jgi:tetratricopeptide (TPR) repeat protein